MACTRARFDWRHRLVLLAALTVALGRPVPAQTPGAGSSAAMPVFALKDQFGRLWQSDSLVGRWVILVTGARSHRDAMITWIDSLHRNFGDDSTRVRTLVVADMRSVPGFMLRMAGQRAPREPHRRVLLDREGTVARQLGLDAETFAVVVVAPDGQVRSRLRGAAATREQLDAIRRLLATR